MGLYLVPFPKTNGDFSRKSQIIPTPIYLTPPLMAFHHTVLSALGVSAIMRYINRRFTYLLTYIPLAIG